MPRFTCPRCCRQCSLADEGFELLEHHAARWLDAATIDDVQWLPADVQVVEAIKGAGVL